MSGAQESDDTLVVALRWFSRRSTLGLFEWSRQLLVFLACTSEGIPDNECTLDIVPDGVNSPGPKYKDLLRGFRTAVEEWYFLRTQVEDAILGTGGGVAAGSGPGGAPRRVIFVGHMLGGAIASTALIDLLVTGVFEKARASRGGEDAEFTAHAYTFGGSAALTAPARFYMQHRMDHPKAGRVEVGHYRIVQGDGLGAMIAKILQCFDQKTIAKWSINVFAISGAAFIGASVATGLGVISGPMTGGFSWAVFGVGAASAYVGSQVGQWFTDATLGVTKLSVDHFGTEYHFFYSRENPYFSPERCTGCQIHMSNDACDKSAFRNAIETSLASVYQCGLRSRQNWWAESSKTGDLFFALGKINANIIGYNSDFWGWSPELSATAIAAFAGDYHLLGRNFPFTCLPGGPGQPGGPSGEPLCIDNYLGGTYVKKSGQCPPGHRIGKSECKKLAAWNKLRNYPGDLAKFPPGCTFSSPSGGTPYFKVGHITTATGTCSATEICLCREPDHISHEFRQETPCLGAEKATWMECEGIGAEEPPGGPIDPLTLGWCYDSEIDEPAGATEVGWIWNTYEQPKLHSLRFIPDPDPPPYPGTCGLGRPCNPPGVRGKAPVDLRNAWGKAPNCPRGKMQEDNFLLGIKPITKGTYKMLPCFRCFKKLYEGNLMNQGPRNGYWPEDVEALYPFRDK